MGQFTDDSQTSWIDDIGQILNNVHPADQCLNPNGCTIHGPSNHSMVYFPQVFRADRGFMERICPHQIGHPDPDELPIFVNLTDSIHGCDGCCSD